MDQIDKRIIARVQGDLPLVSRPFAELARELGLSEEQVVERLKALKERGVMRRFGATLRHQRSGFAANVMVAWRVEEERADQVGGLLAAHRRVSHCYHRRACPDFPFNLYSMVHGRSSDECRQLVEEMAAETQVADYIMLFSVEELKKTSMQYY